MVRVFFFFFFFFFFFCCCFCFVFWPKPQNPWTLSYKLNERSKFLLSFLFSNIYLRTKVLHGPLFSVVFETLTTNKQNLYRNVIFDHFPFHKSQMSNADTEWHFRHVPSINRACKFPLIGGLHSDNCTDYITNAYGNLKCRNTKTDELTTLF